MERFGRARWQKGDLDVSRAAIDTLARFTVERRALGIVLRALVQLSSAFDMLGHATLEMVNNYLTLANADLQKKYRIASPVDHWRL